MSELVFDEHAQAYDAWFLENQNVLASEVLLLKKSLGEKPGKSLSVGCGTGLFEQQLRQHHGIDVRFGLEPAAAMAEVAVRRGMEVAIGVAEELPFESGSFDTVYLNGCPSYIPNLLKAFEEAARVLRPGGAVVVLDVPAESSFALLYRLGASEGSWQRPLFAGVAPACPYPVELAAGANWRTTPEKLELLERAGFRTCICWQTLTRHPVYTNDQVEEPSPGFDRGDYVAIRGLRAEDQ